MTGSIIDFKIEQYYTSLSKQYSGFTKQKKERRDI